jgi:hypothetical protein
MKDDKEEIRKQKKEKHVNSMKEDKDTKNFTIKSFTLLTFS